MANETQIYGHIKNKHDLEVNWLKAVNFTPKDGELIVYEAETASDPLPEGRTTRYTKPRLKVGDGKTNVNDLPFVTSGSSSEGGGGGDIDIENVVLITPSDIDAICGTVI